MALTAEEKQRFLQALREDEEFRYAVLGLLGLTRLEEALAELTRVVAEVRERQQRLEERQQKLEEMMARLEERQQRLEERQQKLEERMLRVEEEIRSLREETKRLWEEVRDIRECLIAYKLRLDGIDRRLEKYEKILGAIGRRHGLGLERTILDIYRDALEKLGIKAYHVEKLGLVDEKGEVFGVRNQVVDIDVYIRDDVCWMLEVKNTVERDDVLLHYHKARWAMRRLGRKCQLAVVAVYITRGARELATRLGMQVVAGYTIPDEGEE